MVARPPAFAELGEELRLFVEQQEMMFVATFDDDGEHACTFRSGPPGFVRVLDVNRLAWPEYAGDVELEAIDVSLLFLNGARDAIGLHIDGRAKVLDDRSMRRAYRCLPEPMRGAEPAHWVTVYVEEVHT
jgi:hypothetical protein